MTLFPPTPPTVQIDGGTVRRLREAKSLTQLYVAEVVGVTVDTVSRWENNRTQAVKRSNAEALAQALGVPLPEILQETEVPGTTEAEPQTTRSPNRRLLWAGLAGVAVLGLGAWFVLRSILQPPTVVQAERMLPPYTPPRSEVPVVIDLRLVSGTGRHAVLRETLPEGWILKGAVPPPDQGPTPEGVVKWILPLEGGHARVVYLAQTPPAARESSAHRFFGDVLTSGGVPAAFPVKGPSRIDLEYLHWADEDADFQISDEEVLAALERLESAPDLGLDPKDLRRLWGAPEYEWVESAGGFVPRARR